MYDPQGQQPAAVFRGDCFPGIPTNALLQQMELIAQTLAYRGTAAAASVAYMPQLEPQQLLALQLQQYPPQQQQQPVAVAAAVNGEAWAKMPNMVKQPTTTTAAAAASGVSSSVSGKPSKLKWGPFKDKESGRFYWKACPNQRPGDAPIGHCPCRYWMMEKLDGAAATTTGGTKRPRINSAMLHIRDLRKKDGSSPAAVDAELRSLLGDWRIPFVDVEVRNKGYAEISFDHHSDAAAAWKSLTAHGMSVNFARVLDGRK